MASVTIINPHYEPKTDTVEELRLAAPVEGSSARFWYLLAGILLFGVITFLLFKIHSLNQEVQGFGVPQTFENQAKEMAQLKGTIQMLEEKLSIQQKSYRTMSDAVYKTNRLLEKMSQKWEGEQSAKLQSLNEFNERLTYLEINQRSREQIEKELLHYKQYEVLRSRS